MNHEEADFLRCRFVERGIAPERMQERRRKRKQGPERRRGRYAKNDDGAAKLSEASGKTVKKGNIVLYEYVGAYTIVKNEDGTSGTIKYPSGKIEYSELTENSVFFVVYDSYGDEITRVQLSTLEYLGFPVTGIVE